LEGDGGKNSKKKKSPENLAEEKDTDKRRICSPSSGRGYATTKKRKQRNVRKYPCQHAENGRGEDPKKGTRKGCARQKK